MATRVLMPKGSDTMTEGKVLKWLKREGDSVSTGDSLVEIETDKVNMEVEAMGGGVLRKILVEADQSVPVGQLLAVIGKADEDISAMVSAAAPPVKPDGHDQKAASGAATPAPAAKQASAPPLASAPAPAVAPGGRVLASPLARRMATERGVDISRVQGSGPAGRIVRRDVESAATPGFAPARASYPPLSGPEYRDEPLSSMRKIIAQRLGQSLGPIPHFYLTIEVDFRRAKELRESANTLDPNLKLSYNDIILKACAAALRQHPEVNASFMGESIRFHNRVHLGLAVAIDGGGLITPVIRDCDRKSMQQISAEAKDLIARARARRLKPEEYTGGTFSVSNLGMLGIQEFSAVINPPEAAILAIGGVEEKPVVTEGRIEIGFRCRMTMSCDHRVVDGATGAKFLQTLRQILENPVYLAF
jgi:pyruvate dehydrogenase E2 component (dihydrolipoyllysine-residue acetyltransferase)